MASLRSEGLLHSHPVEQANILNKQFQSAFSTKETYNQHEFSFRCQMSGKYPSAAELTITENGILKLLININQNKAAGPDNIRPRLLKELAKEIAPILTLIFQTSIETGDVPSDWRNANVSPVFKKGERYRAENYRPISLTCICCKLIEHIITSYIINHGSPPNSLPITTWLSLQTIL